MFLAVAAAAAGYAGLIACSRDAAPRQVERPTVFVPRTDPTGVQDLAPMTLPPRAAPAAFREIRTELPAGVATIELVGASGAELAAGTGVAVLDGRSGALLAWHELVGAAPALLSFADIPAGDHWVTLASGRAHARFGYATRVPLKMAQEGDAVAGSATLEVGTQDVTVALAWATDEPPCYLVLPLVRRLDDAAWRLPSDAFDPVTKGSTMVLRRLGAGSYELQLEGVDVVADKRSLLRFTIPGTDRIELQCRRR